MCVCVCMYVCVYIHVCVCVCVYKKNLSQQTSSKSCKPVAVG